MKVKDIKAAKSESIKDLNDATAIVRLAIEFRHEHLIDKIAPEVLKPALKKYLSES